MIHASVGFRVAYRAIPQSLMEKLEALNGGRQSAISCRWECCSHCGHSAWALPHTGHSLAIELLNSVTSVYKLTEFAVQFAEVPFVVSGRSSFAKFSSCPSSPGTAHSAPPEGDLNR